MARNLAEYGKRNYRALLIRERTYERAVQKVLLGALNDMRATLAVIYDKYAADGVLTLAQMTQYHRLTTLERQMIDTLDDAARSSLGTINRLRPEQYGESFFRTAWSVDQASGLELRWGQLNRAAVVESLNNRAYQLSVSSYTRDAEIRILRALNNGLAQGKAYTTMARDIKGAINATYYQAQRIIRTEGQSAINAGQDASYTVAEERGVQMTRRWMATLDGDTRDSHQEMDGEEKHEDGLYHLPSGETAPYPAHPGLTAKERIQCRCGEISVIDDYAPSLRRSREDGVLPYQDYETWKDDRKTWKKV